MEHILDNDQIISIKVYQITRMINRRYINVFIYV